MMADYAPTRRWPNDEQSKTRGKEKTGPQLLLNVQLISTIRLFQGSECRRDLIL